MTTATTDYRGTMDERAAGSRLRIADLAAGAAAVLDVGCANGYIGEHLRRRHGASYLAGIELDGRLAREAGAHYDLMLEGDAEDAGVWERLPRKFDAVIAADVLEHLRRPEVALDRIRRALTDAGTLIVSLPNVAYWEVRRDLFFRGRWEYADWGILDRNHLRFFTRDSGRSLLERAGFTVTLVEPVFIDATGSRLAWLPLFRRWRRRHPGVFASQHIFSARVAR
ncbi:MAG: class I SAM-dependent methyltransferase [Candidatus Edwardsbacteria bacterium]|jgi:SAM-dependent methyltransferase|nr:class I SAM-dependent methyltransferase [Candidatus Edwardsbacteria bacterium]